MQAATLQDPGQDYEAPGQDSGDAFPSVCLCVVFIKTLMLVQHLDQLINPRVLQFCDSDETYYC